MYRILQKIENNTEEPLKAIAKGKLSKRIEYGYDRSCKSWVTIVFNENDDEIESSYTGNKESRDFVIKYFMEKYNIEKSNIIKIKAY